MADVTITGIETTVVGDTRMESFTFEPVPVTDLGYVVSVAKVAPAIDAVTVGTIGQPSKQAKLDPPTSTAVSDVGEVRAASRLTTPDNIGQSTVASPGRVGRASYVQPAVVTTTVTSVGFPNRHGRIVETSTTAVSDLGNVRASAARIDGLSIVVATSDGAIRRTQSGYSLPEDRYRDLGYRPFATLLVYAVDVTSDADVTAANTPDGGSFVLSPIFFSDTCPAFWSVGGRPGCVGTRVGSAYYFRPPVRREVVWRIVRDAQGRVAPAEFLMCVDDAAGTWREFQPYAYRGVLSQLQYVADQLDPGGAIQYYAQLLGAIGSQLGQDNLDLAAITDPDATPSRFLPLMADAVGVDVDDADEDDEKRRRIRSAFNLHRNKGTYASSVAAIREAGFAGYVRELWVNPSAAGNWTDPATAPLAVRAYLVNQGLLTSVRASSGLKGSDLIERPHNYANDDAGPTYFPSSRVAVHINNTDGSPVQATQQDALDRLFGRLRTYCLPGHVDVREFVTDVGGGGADGFAVSDAVTVTELADGGSPPTCFRLSNMDQVQYNASSEPNGWFIDAPGPNANVFKDRSAIDPTDYPTPGEGWWTNGDTAMYGSAILDVDAQTITFVDSVATGAVYVYAFVGGSGAFPLGTYAYDGGASSPDPVHTYPATVVATATTCPSP